MLLLPVVSFISPNANVYVNSSVPVGFVYCKQKGQIRLLKSGIIKHEIFNVFA